MLHQLRFLLVAATATAALAAPAANAQPVDCACAATYQVGDRFVALADNPSSATDLPASSTGTVICGRNPPIIGLDILIRWDDFSNGSDLNVDVCNCPVAVPGSGTSADWFVACAEIELLATPVRNVTQGTSFPTLQAALDAANTGDAIEIDPVTPFVDGISAPANLSVTITGAGKDQTIIHGLGDASPNGTILSFSRGTVSISNLTLRNGRDDVNATACAVGVFTTDLTCTNVAFVNNSASRAHLDANTANAAFANCTFEGSSGRDTSGGRSGSVLSFTNCLVLAGSTPRTIRVDSSTANVLNCTVTGVCSPVGATINFTNSSLSDGFFQLQFSGTLNASRSLFAGATGDNIDGTPTFVDAANGDYRLAPGSLGIDAADADAHLAAIGSTSDLGGAFRFRDDAGTANTGVGVFDAMDIGAFEFQETSPVGDCPGDLNGDNMVDINDLNILFANFGLSCNRRTRACVLIPGAPRLVPWGIVSFRLAHAR